MARIPGHPLDTPLTAGSNPPNAPNRTRSVCSLQLHSTTSPDVGGRRRVSDLDEANGARRKWHLRTGVVALVAIVTMLALGAPAFALVAGAPGATTPTTMVRRPVVRRRVATVVRHRSRKRHVVRRVRHPRVAAHPRPTVSTTAPSSSTTTTTTVATGSAAPTFGGGNAGLGLRLRKLRPKSISAKSKSSSSSWLSPRVVAVLVAIPIVLLGLGLVGGELGLARRFRRRSSSGAHR